MKLEKINPGNNEWFKWNEDRNEFIELDNADYLRYEKEYLRHLQLMRHPVTFSEKDTTIDQFNEIEKQKKEIKEKEKKLQAEQKKVEEERAEIEKEKNNLKEMRETVEKMQKKMEDDIWDKSDAKELLG